MGERACLTARRDGITGAGSSGSLSPETARSAMEVRSGAAEVRRTLSRSDTTRRRVRARDPMHYTVLGLIQASTGGVHGYDLKRRFDALYREIWTLTFGQRYRILARLEAEGLIRGTVEVQGRRPTRTIYTVTPRGYQSVEEWLLLKPRSEPSSPRDELSVRLLFLLDRRQQACDVIQAQRATESKNLERLARRRAVLEEQGDTALAQRLLLLQIDMLVQAR